MYQNMYNNPAPMGNYNPYEQNVGLLKNFFSKPIVLILAVFNGMSLLLSIISFFVQMGSLDTTIRYYTYVLGSQFSSLYSNIQPIFVIVSLIAILFSVLTFLGYLLLYLKSKSPDSQSNPSTGAKILWIMSIIEFVLICIAVLILIIIAFLIFSLTGQVSRSQADIMGVIGVILIIVSIFVFFSSFFKLRFFASINSSFNSVQITSKSAIAFAVFSIIMAVASIITLFSNLETYSFMTIISNIINIINYIFLVVFAISYNSFVKSLTNGTTPVNGFMPNNQMNYDPYVHNPNSNAPNMNMGYSYRPSQPPVNDNTQFSQHNNQQYQNPYGNSTFNQDFDQAPAKPQNDTDNGFSQNSAGQAEPKAQNKCPICGTVHSDDDMFCGNCGARLK